MQLAAFVVFLVLGTTAKSPLLLALARFVVVGVPIWFVLYLILNQIRRVRIEALETVELRRAQASGTTQAIFDLDDEALLLEQRRLFWMVRWLLPTVTVVVSLSLILGQLIFWRLPLNQALDGEAFAKTSNPTLMMWFVIGIGFLCFLYARYALAVARIPQWGLIRPGALALVGSAMASLLVAFSLMTTTSTHWAEGITAYLLGIGLLILGLELAVNFVLDLYRPRTPGEVPRPAFDSRLLGMIAEPGGFAKSIAEGMNYQFGFQVSTTWFYQLLQRWLFPIVVVAFVVILSLTSVVFVDADEQVIVEHFGQRAQNATSILSPGIHFKWPFPVDIVYRTPVKRIREIVIGEAGEADDEHGHEHEGKAILWTEKHEFVAETMLLVASPKVGSRELRNPRRRSFSMLKNQTGESVAVSLMMVSVPIEYRVKNILDYMNRYKDPEKVLESIANQHLSEYGASVDIDRLIGPGREEFNQQLDGLLQKKADELKLGVEIVFAGIRGAHPPSQANVAKAFQAAISAQTNMAAIINAARGEAKRVLIEEAGTEAGAYQLDEAILARDRLTTGSEPYLKAQQRVTDLLVGNVAEEIAPLSGNAAAKISRAHGAATDRISREAAKAYTFGAQLAAFRTSPELYMQRKRLELYTGLHDIRKFLIVGDPSNVIIEYDVTQEAGMDQILGEGVAKERSRGKK